MGKIYKVYDPQQNTFLLGPRASKAEVIADADSVADLDHFTGKIEVHEIDDEDTTLASAVVVYSRRA